MDSSRPSGRGRVVQIASGDYFNISLDADALAQTFIRPEFLGVLLVIDEVA